MKKVTIKSKELKNNSFIEVSKKDKVELIDNKLISVNSKIVFFLDDKKYVPTLRLVLERPEILPKVTIDKGAIRFVINGADIMRPGVTRSETQKENQYVCIVDENLGKPLAIGKILIEKFMEESSGKVIKNLHHYNDELWQITS